MIKDYISIDIENPNARGNSICSIGIIVVNNNEVVDEKYSLINPEDRFDINNSNITGLNYADVKDAPTFKEYWKNIKELLENNIIIGHNITYELTVIAKALERYDIEVPIFNYYCTLNLSRSFISTNSYSLDNLCDLLNINLENHHNALEDAKASQRIFEYLNCNNDIGSCEKFEFESKLSEDLDSKLATNIITEYERIELEKLVTSINASKMYSE